MLYWRVYSPCSLSDAERKGAGFGTEEETSLLRFVWSMDRNKSLYIIRNFSISWYNLVRIYHQYVLFRSMLIHLLFSCPVGLVSNLSLLMRRVVPIGMLSSNSLLHHTLQLLHSFITDLIVYH